MNHVSPPPSRRALLAAVPATAVAGTAAAQPTASKAATFVLVHGAWHGGWCWERVATRLRAKGHRVFAPTLTGLCERSHLMSPAVNLDTHIADIVNDMRWKDLGPVVLVGDSYGGMVITGVAEQVPERIGTIVYLDAFIPADGQSVQDMAGSIFNFSGPTVPAPKAAGFNVNMADRAWVDSKLTAQPTPVMTQKLKVTGAYRRVPKRIYIQAVLKGRGNFDSTVKGLAGEPGWIFHKVESGHDVMLDKPDELTALLESAI